MKITATSRRLLRTAEPGSYAAFIAFRRVEAEMILAKAGIASPPSVSSRLYALRLRLSGALTEAEKHGNPRRRVALSRDLREVSEILADLDGARRFDSFRRFACEHKPLP